MIDLKKTKEDLRNFPKFPEEKKTIEKMENAEKKIKESPKKEKITLESYFVQKEKEFSSKILKASTEKELMKIYFEEKHKKYPKKQDKNNQSF